MPLTPKGNKIKSALEKEYGKEKGERVLYAGKKKGTFTGIDATPKGKALAAAKREVKAIRANDPKAALKANAKETEAEKQMKRLQAGDRLSGRDRQKAAKR